MSKGRRVREVLLGLLTIALSNLMFIEPDAGFKLTMFILCLALCLAGMRYIVYFIRMGRHMVGGKSLLFLGIAMLDLGIFSLSLSDYPLAYIVIYLLAAHAFSGVIGIMRALEARSQGARSKWKLRFATGVIDLLVAILAILCGVVFRSTEMVTYIYCAGLCYSGFIRIVNAFRRSAIVYIA